MTQITIRTTIKSETIHLPELKPLIGKQVEIVIREAPAAGATTAGDWDAAMQAARELEDYDFDAWREQREYDLRHAQAHVP